MRAYIPYSSITFSPSNPWFDWACSSAVSDREGALLLKHEAWGMSILYKKPHPAETDEPSVQSPIREQPC